MRLLATIEHTVSKTACHSKKHGPVSAILTLLPPWNMVLKRHTPSITRRSKGLEERDLRGSASKWHGLHESNMKPAPARSPGNTEAHVAHSATERSSCIEQLHLQLPNHDRSRPALAYESTCTKLLTSSGSGVAQQPCAGCRCYCVVTPFFRRL